MKKNQPPLIIRIPEPCTVGEEVMTPTAKGEFCSECSRELTDFSDFTDAQLIAHLQQQEGKLCGIFSKDQLNRNLMPSPVAKPSFQHLSLPALALLAMTMTTQISYGQTPDTVRTEIIPTAMPVPIPQIRPVVPGTDTISGTVYTRGAGRLKHVRVALMSGDTVLQTTKTDADGNFTFVVLPGQTPRNMRFEKRNYGDRKIDLKVGAYNPDKPVVVYMRKKLSRRDRNKRVMGKMAYL